MFGGLLIDEHTDTYSKYWVNFLSAYRNEGINFYALTLQNEPDFENDGYPSMLLRPYQQQALAKRLRYDLIAAGFENTKILVHDHNWDIWEQPMEVLSDPEAKAAIDGTAWHCYGGDMNVLINHIYIEYCPAVISLSAGFCIFGLTGAQRGSQRPPRQGDLFHGVHWYICVQLMAGQLQMEYAQFVYG